LTQDIDFHKPPTIVWKKWSESDPQAAYRFLEEVGSITFGFDDFFDGYEKKARPQDIFEFSRELLTSESQFKDDLGPQLRNYLVLNENYTRDFLAWQEETDDFSLSRATLKQIGFYQSSGKELGRAILESIPGEQRLDQIRQSFRLDENSENYRIFDSRKDWYRENLREMGHSEAEIADLLSD
jgi:hypothetical protein